MKTFILTAALVLLAAALFAQDIALPAPRTRLGVDLMEAIESRTAAREFVKREVPPADLAAILWAANGVRRGPDALSAASKAGRTIPVSGPVDYINVYVLNDKGAYAYEAESNRLRQVATGDVRAAAIGRPSATSAFTLLFSCDAAKLPAFIKSNAGMNTQLMHGNAGFAAQNAMLAAAALKLDSIVMYNLKAKDAAAALKLGPEEQPLFIVQFGWRR